ncbi:LbetaH domain-containing protein [Novispirillum itersonii]|uniref:Chloramphenicol acetyltransferase n=1 Tax=Novispirillum itersonii TaxID=189 RepID=A0A7W9ZHT4_NOVIT|nr:chloramphenicol acetyltransferase [Novispirillum itersonii]MBB6211747.1 hypothetical protein [Novispirillum itersonii]
MSTKTLGDTPLIDPTAEVRDCTFGRFCEVGARTSISETVMDDYSYVVNDSEIIYTRIGKFANIAAHTRINPGQHPMQRASQHHFLYRSEMYGMGQDDDTFFDWRRSSPVEIGHDAWIGHGVVIKGGVRIGIGAVIGSGAVVTRDVPDYAIVTGMPGTVLRYRFPEAVRAALLDLRWWDWDHATLTAALPDFRSLSAEEFCAKYAGTR